MIVDSHCHLDRLDLSKYQGELKGAFDAAKNNGVTHMLCVSVLISDFPRLVAIADNYAHISLSVGLHPNEIVENETSTEELIRLAQHPKVVAIGETGLDYFRLQGGDVKPQHQRFIAHINAARQLKKPLIIHTRQSGDDTITLMKEHHADECKGVMHCFADSWEIAKKALDQGFYISFSGIVTFKNAQSLRDVAKKVPLDRLLIETDSPYLAPDPHRGKSNEPAYVRYVAEYLSTYLNVSYEKFAVQTTNNFFTLFSAAIKASGTQACIVP